MRFDFASAGRILFGCGRLPELGDIAASFGSRAFVVTGRDRRRVEPILQVLRTAGLETAVFAVPGEPTIDLVQEGVSRARTQSPDVVVGVGGGSAIDAGKAISALMTNPGEALDYLEVVGGGRSLENSPAHFIAIPTTAGTGSEVTRNAVLASPRHGVKVSLRHPGMLPRVALVDPELTFRLPAEVTASTGLDALTQLIEPFVSCRANPVTDAFCREGIGRVARSLPIAHAHVSGGDPEPVNAADPVGVARTDLALGSLLSGLALANAGLGAVHGFAAPLGGMYEAPHGAVCAALLPNVMEANIRALQSRAPDHPALARYEELARIMTDDQDARSEQGVECVREMSRRMSILGLSRWGVDSAQIPSLVEKAARASSMKGNPVALSPGELADIVERSL